jgi:flagellar motility protein MotE (MotC chaperone)
MADRMLMLTTRFGRMETMMTPQERYTRMENLVHSVIEAQANLSERQEKQQKLVEEDRAAIRDLIAVSRSVIESQKQTQATLQVLAEKQARLTEDIKALQETVREHEGKIEALIDTVDRIIRRGQPPN